MNYVILLKEFLNKNFIKKIKMFSKVDYRKKEISKQSYFFI